MKGPERERFEMLVTAAVDGELDTEGRRELEEILRDHPELRIEMEDQMEVKEVVGTLHFVQPPEEVWDRYRYTVLHRTERRVGWTLFLVGGGLLVGYGGYEALRELVLAEDLSLLVKGGILATLSGLAILLGSILRERFYLKARERYDEVIR